MPIRAIKNSLISPPSRNFGSQYAGDIASAAPSREKRARRRSKAQIARLMSAFLEAGGKVGSLEVQSDGTIRIIAANGSPTETSDPFSQWEGRL